AVLSGGDGRARRVADELEPELARHAAAGDVGAVVVDLDAVDGRVGEGALGQLPRDLGREPAAQVRDVDPVADLGAPGADPEVQAAAADELPVEPHAEELVDARQPPL